MSRFSICCQFLKIEAYRLFPGVCSLNYRSFNFPGFFVGSEEKEVIQFVTSHTYTPLQTCPHPQSAPAAPSPSHAAPRPTSLQAATLFRTSPDPALVVVPNGDEMAVASTQRMARGVQHLVDRFLRVCDPRARHLEESETETAQSEGTPRDTPALALRSKLSRRATCTKYDDARTA